MFKNCTQINYTTSEVDLTKLKIIMLKQTVQIRIKYN